MPLRIEALDAPRTVAYRWNNEDARARNPEKFEVQGSTVFTFTLEPVPEGTQFTVVETGFEDTSDPAANMEDHRGGWDSELDNWSPCSRAGRDGRNAGPGVRRARRRDPVEHPAALGEGDASASALAGRLPVSRQAIAKHLAVLEQVGLVEPVRVGREVQFHVLGSQLSDIAHRLDAIGAEWDRRLAAIREIAEGL